MYDFSQCKYEKTKGISEHYRSSIRIENWARLIADNRIKRESKLLEIK